MSSPRRKSQGDDPQAYLRQLFSSMSLPSRDKTASPSAVLKLLDKLETPKVPRTERKPKRKPKLTPPKHWSAERAAIGRQEQAQARAARAAKRGGRKSTQQGQQPSRKQPSRKQPSRKQSSPVEVSARPIFELQARGSPNRELVDMSISSGLDITPPKVKPSQSAVPQALLLPGELESLMGAAGRAWPLSRVKLSAKQTGPKQAKPRRRHKRQRLAALRKKAAARKIVRAFRENKRNKKKRAALSALGKKAAARKIVRAFRENKKKRAALKKLSESLRKIARMAEVERLKGVVADLRARRDRLRLEEEERDKRLAVLGMRTLRREIPEAAEAVVESRRLAKETMSEIQAAEKAAESGSGKRTKSGSGKRTKSGSGKRTKSGSSYKILSGRKAIANFLKAAKKPSPVLSPRTAIRQFLKKATPISSITRAQTTSSPEHLGGQGPSPVYASSPRSPARRSPARRSPARRSPARRPARCKTGQRRDVVSGKCVGQARSRCKAGQRFSEFTQACEGPTRKRCSKGMRWTGRECSR